MVGRSPRGTPKPGVGDWSSIVTEPEGTVLSAFLLSPSFGASPDPPQAMHRDIIMG